LRKGRKCRDKNKNLQKEQAKYGKKQQGIEREEKLKKRKNKAH